MTIIMGAISGDETILTSDSLASEDYYQSEYGPKVFTLSGWVIGVSNSFTALQILQSSLALAEECPMPAAEHELEDISILSLGLLRPLITDVIGTEEIEILIGGGGKLWHIQADWAVFPLPYAAIGSGSSYALGSYYSQAGTTPARDRLLEASKAAEFFCPSVKGPFHTVVAGK